MISPMTPPGTHLVVVKVPKSFEEALEYVHPDVRHRVSADWDWTDPFSEGACVVLDRISREALSKTGFCVYLMGFPGSRFPLEQFRVADLPSWLTGLLDGAPVDDDAEAELVS